MITPSNKLKHKGLWIPEHVRTDKRLNLLERFIISTVLALIGKEAHTDTPFLENAGRRVTAYPERQKGSQPMIPPTIGEVQAFCRETSFVSMRRCL